MGGLAREGLAGDVELRCILALWHGIGKNVLSESSGFGGTICAGISSSANVDNMRCIVGPVSNIPHLHLITLPRETHTIHMCRKSKDPCLSCVGGTM